MQGGEPSQQAQLRPGTEEAIASGESGVGGRFDAGIRAGPGPESPVRFVLLVILASPEGREAVFF